MANWAQLRRAMLVDVYHSGIVGHPRAPFLLLPAGAEGLPPHPDGTRTWAFWRSIPINAFLKKPKEAKEDIERVGFYIE